MKPLLVLACLAVLAACENPDFTMGASISGDGISPTFGVSDSNIAVSVSP